MEKMRALVSFVLVSVVLGALIAVVALFALHRVLHGFAVS